MLPILFIHHGNQWIRGSEISLLIILEHIDKNNFLPYVLSNNKALLGKVKELNIECYHSSIPEIMIDHPYYKFEIFQYFKFVKFLRRIIKNKKIKLLYSNSGLPTQSGYLVSRLCRIPIITHLRSPLAKRYAWLWLFRYSHLVLFVSKSIQKSLEYKVRFKNTTKVVYNGIDVHDFHPFPRTDTSQRRLMGIRDQDIVIGQVGSLIHRKGCDLVIRAFSKLLASQNNLRLVLVGSGEEHDRLVNLACKLGLESHVIFAGESDNTKLFFQEIFDVHVLASRSEALGRVLLEASACGLPTVASNCGGTPEVITHGRNGFLFSVDDYEDLFRQLMKLINDSSLRYHFGQNARDDTVRRFSIDTHIQKIQNSIQDIYIRFSSN